MGQVVNLEKTFLKEMKQFLFYSQWVWPTHRKLAKNIITPRCNNCVVSAHLIPLNADGLCQICVEETRKGINHSKNNTASFSNNPSNTEYAKELESILQGHKRTNNSDHDAAVLFSGGKDSSYLIHYLKHTFPHLRLLLLTVDNTFMSPYALKNIAAMVEKFDLEHVQLRPPASICEKMFRYAFLHLNSKGCSGTVDQFDGDLIHDMGRNFAQMYRIPFLISGCSKTQVERILGLKHFESPQEDEAKKRTHVAEIPLDHIFNTDEMHYWWDGSIHENRPRVLFPFHAWDYEENYIIKKVTEWNIFPPYSQSPLLTNNQLIPLMTIVDMIQLKYCSFEGEFSEMVRRGKADPVFWRSIFEMTEYAAKTGHFVSQSVDLSLKRLNLTRKDLGIPA